MATRHVHKVLSPKNRATSLDVERENFEKYQITSITKAVNSTESPVKEKHVRRIIIGTFKDQNSSLFWATARKIPLQENPIVCWKFCHVLHKVLREGYKRVIADAFPFRSMILDLGKMWGLLKEGYGKLIQNYCSLLVNKIDFHARNQRFPGNLMVTDDELDNIGERDVNVFFQLSCEMFDYLDEILGLQASVFGSLDMSRANSMTNAGQCRLAPLICCIQDSSQLYDYSVKVLFKLHSALPPGTLDGHRSRFLQQFKILKQFYINSSNLQYFRNLIQVPQLPENPPNFLLASDIKSHVTPVVILPQQPESPDGSESMVDNLIDLSLPRNHDESLNGEKQNGSYNFEVLQEKERMAQRLNQRIEDLEIEIQQIRIEDSRLIDSLKKTISESELRLTELEKNLLSLREEKDNCAKELDEVRQELARHKAGTDIQTEVAKATEKFQKLKEIYQQLRTEHIELLRSKAETDKSLTVANGEVDKLTEHNKELEVQVAQLMQVENDTRDRDEKFQDMANKNEALESFNKKLLSEMALLQQEKLQVESKLSEISRNVNSLKQQLIEKQEASTLDLLEKDYHYLGLILEENQAVVVRVANEDEIASMSRNVTCTPEYFFVQNELLEVFVSKLASIAPSLRTQQPEFDEIGASLMKFYHQLIHVFNCGRVIYQTLPNIELGQDLMNKCKDLVNHCSQLCNEMKTRDGPISFSQLEQCVHDIANLKYKVIPEASLNQSQNLEELLHAELSDMDKAIQDAANRIEQMMNNAKKQDTGVKLEVNGKILDACTLLMQRIIELIKNSKELQNEIIAQGKGSVSSKEFYQRNHRWTEGLISASKVVALAAKLLVDAADKVVSGKAKFEELMVASQEIAAATAQLVVASRVKAEKNSEKMGKLSSSSKLVTQATGGVVATAKSCAQLVEETETVDFSSLTLHQAKRLEMESQVHVIELETALAKERMRLAGLRKRHYHLGGVNEGW